MGQAARRQERQDVMTREHEEAVTEAELADALESMVDATPSIAALKSAIGAYLRDVPQPTDVAIRIVFSNVIDALGSAGCSYREIAAGTRFAVTLAAAYEKLEDEGEEDETPD